MTQKRVSSKIRGKQIKKQKNIIQTIAKAVRDTQVSGLCVQSMCMSPGSEPSSRDDAHSNLHDGRENQILHCVKCLREIVKTQ